MKWIIVVQAMYDVTSALAACALGDVPRHSRGYLSTSKPTFIRQSPKKLPGSLLSGIRDERHLDGHSQEIQAKSSRLCGVLFFFSRLNGYSFARTRRTPEIRLFLVFSVLAGAESFRNRNWLVPVICCLFGSGCFNATCDNAMIFF